MKRLRPMMMLTVLGAVLLGAGLLAGCDDDHHRMSYRPTYKYAPTFRDGRQRWHQGDWDSGRDGRHDSRGDRQGRDNGRSGHRG